jgi:hypothetical protein
MKKLIFLLLLPLLTFGQFNPVAFYEYGAQKTKKPISYYRFNGDVLDNYLGAFNGTVSGSMTYGTGKSGQAIILTGSNQVIAPINILPVSTSYSLSFFFKADDTASEYRMCEFNNNASTVPFLHVSINATGANIVRFQVGNTPQITIFTTVTDSTQWTHLVVTVNQSTGLKMYVNGVLTSSSASIPGFVQIAAGISNNIGASRNSTLRFKGLIDGFGVWGKELTSTDVLNIYNKQNSGLELF